MGESRSSSTSSVYEINWAPGTRRSSRVCAYSSSPTAHQTHRISHRSAGPPSSALQLAAKRRQRIACGRYRGPCRRQAPPDSHKRTGFFLRGVPTVLIQSTTSCSAHVWSGLGWSGMTDDDSGREKRTERSSMDALAPRDPLCPSVRLWVWREPRVLCAAFCSRSACRRRPGQRMEHEWGSRWRVCDGKRFTCQPMPCNRF